MMRIAVVTPLCPTASEPYSGNPITQTIVALRRYAEVEVFYPRAAFPHWHFLQPRKFLYSAADRHLLLPEAHPIEYPALPLLSRPFNGRRCARRLVPFLERSKPDLILAYWLYPEGYGAVVAGEQLGIPVILGARGSDLCAIPGAITRRLIRSALEKASFVLAVSEELRQRAMAFGVPGERVRVISNGCDSSLFHPADRAAARAGLGVAPEARLALYVGRLQPVKGLHELLEASARLVGSHPQLQVALIGEGILKKELQARAARPDLAGHVRLLGSRSSPEVARWLAAADLVCLPSHSEGCPNVVLEALSCGRPVVASDVGGTSELVDSRCAILVPPGNVPRLAQALEEALRRTWDEAAIAARLSRGWEDVGAETYETCRAVLEERSPAAV